MIANFLLFQVGWFASVLGAAWNAPWIGVAVVGLILVVHLAIRGTRREWIVIGAAAILGVVVDSLLLHSGLVSYRSQTPSEWWAPAWIVAMWANLAATVRHSLAWLSSRWIAAGALGAVFGPLAYWGAARLGAAELTRPMLASAILAAVWGAALPALFWISERYR